MHAAPPLDPVKLPRRLADAVLRGLVGRCPRCGEGRLFGKWLKPLAACPCCAVDLTPQNADDFPAYISIFVTGHAMAPLLILLILDFELSAAMVGAIALPLAVGMMLGVLQPAKGVVIAIQWWLGLGDFRRERAPEAEGS